MKRLSDWANDSGIKLLQLLPINDTTATHTWKDSYPYAAVSVFALHPIYMHLQSLAGNTHKKLLDKYNSQRIQLNALHKVDYEAALALKWKIVKQLFPLLKEATFVSTEYKNFIQKNDYWLKPYCSFCCLRERYTSADFSKWKEGTYSHELAETLMQSASDEVLIHYFVQYHLHVQLKDAVEYAHKHNVVLKGDIAIGVFRNSADVWENPTLYHVDMQAGAPPDDFAVTGQNWGFPTYNWKQMQLDNYGWWRKRLQHTSQYFDAIRLDHILGFFRIWSIPVSATQGILGYFVPAHSISKYELQMSGAHFPIERLYKPYLHYDVLKEIFVENFDNVAATYFDALEEGMYAFKKEFDTQRKIVHHFSQLEQDTFNNWLKQSLLDLSANVILIPADETLSNFHFRFNMMHTTSFQCLNNNAKNGLLYLYHDYFFNRQNALWKNEAMEKLPAIKEASNMLVCGEDLGFTPSSVPEVMDSLGLLRLFIQRMPKQLGSGFEDLLHVPYLSVVSSSTHDTPSIRLWWQQLSVEAAQYYFTNILHQSGGAPTQKDCPGWLNKLILQQHLRSSAMWTIFLLQDVLNISDEHRCENAADEQINHPENPNQYWNYRMPLSLEALRDLKDFNSILKTIIQINYR